LEFTERRKFAHVGDVVWMANCSLEDRDQDYYSTA